MKKIKMVKIIVLGFSALVLPISAAIPQELQHQGRITVDGVNFTGVGQFKFMLYFSETSGTVSEPIWSNSSSEPASSMEPASSVSVSIDKGLYSVFLGEDPQAPISHSLLPPEGSELFLRIWFDDGVNGSQQLVPDRAFASVPFARLATQAGQVSVLDTLVQTGGATSSLSTVSFPAAFKDSPIFVAGVRGTTGGTSIVQEWKAGIDEVDCVTNGTSLDWFAMEKGEFIISGKEVKSGEVLDVPSALDGDGAVTITFPSQFSSEPAVFLLGIDDDGFGQLRLLGIPGTSSCRVKVSSAVDELHWIAMEKGLYSDGNLEWYAGRVSKNNRAVTTHNFSSAFNAQFPRRPRVISTIIETSVTGGPVHGRVSAATNTSFTHTAQSVSGNASEFINYLAFRKFK